MVPAVIPVAGLGTRSLPISKAIPKEMQPVYDRPIIQYIVEEAVASGSEKVILVTSKGKEAIENHFTVNPELEAALLKANKKELYDLVHKISTMVKVETTPQEEPLGLGHAVLMAKNLVTESHFGVLLGDDMMESKPPALKQLINFHESKAKDKSAGVVLLMKVPDEDVSKYGICEVGEDGQITRCVEKPKASETKSRFAIMGRYLLPKDIFDILENQKTGALGEIQLTDALNTLAENGRLYGCVFDGARFDAGDKLGFLKATLYYYAQGGYGAEIQKLVKEVVG
jgi:UTP--glucose-1-phosphate uridylyltransferase